MSEDKPQWPVEVLTKAAVVPHDKQAFQDQYMCDPWSDPWKGWREAGWEFDDRGKPCKWQHRQVITEEQIEEAGPAGLMELIIQTQAKGREHCQAAMKMLEESSEIFVIRSEPQSLVDRPFENGTAVVITRFRVRWCENEHVAARYAEFEQNMLAEVDREQARILRERRRG